MLISFCLNRENAIEIHITEGNLMPKWVKESLNLGLDESLVIIREKDQISKFVANYSQNGVRYTEGAGPYFNLSIKSSISIRNPEQLERIYAVLESIATVDSMGNMRVSPEQFSNLNNIGWKHKDIIYAFQKGAAPGFFSHSLPADNVGRNIDSHFDTKTAGNSASANKSAHITAKKSTKEAAIKTDGSEITFDEFKSRYEQQYKSEIFKNPFSSMKRLLSENKISTINEVQDYIKANSSSRAAKVYQQLIEEHSEGNTQRRKMGR